MFNSFKKTLPSKENISVSVTENDVTLCILHLETENEGVDHVFPDFNKVKAKTISMPLFIIAKGKPKQIKNTKALPKSLEEFGVSLGELCAKYPIEMARIIAGNMDSGYPIEDDLLFEWLRDDYALEIQHLLPKMNGDVLQYFTVDSEQPFSQDQEITERLFNVVTGELQKGEVKPL